MIDMQQSSAVDISVLEVLVMYDAAWLPPRASDACEEMEKLGLVERVGTKWRITFAVPAMFTLIND